VLGLSDEAILAEVNEAGGNMGQEAEWTRQVLRGASKVFDNVNKHLSVLGHAVNSNDWQHGERGYHNNCRDCGLSVNLNVAGEVWGDALGKPCAGGGWYAFGRREASR
jgi:hypothetical protein